MRLMVVAAGGQLLLAARLAAQGGADIICADDVGHARKLMIAGCSADVVLIDPGLLGETLKQDMFNATVIACGTGADASTARAAIAAGASEYLPLPADTAQAAALISALAGDDQKLRASLKIN
jgi:DNA-binding NarL/FixJ family response regulator